jgi:putative endonuclease
MEPLFTRKNRPSTLAGKRSGQLQEQQACRYLQRQGLKWIASNIRYLGGEIDLIMQDSDCWVFVEVRFRRNLNYGGAAASVTRAKQRKLLYAATRWLHARQQSFLTVSCRFDIVAMYGNQIEWLKNAFNADE